MDSMPVARLSDRGNNSESHVAWSLPPIKSLAAPPELVRLVDIHAALPVSCASCWPGGCALGFFRSGESDWYADPEASVAGPCRNYVFSDKRSAAKPTPAFGRGPSKARARS